MFTQQQQNVEHIAQSESRSNEEQTPEELQNMKTIYHADTLKAEPHSPQDRSGISGTF